jgi:hypothetical protein
VVLIELALTALSQPDGLSEALGQEMADAMVAVCASAFAVEAIIGAIARIAIPQIAAKWEKPGQLPKTAGRVREVLKSAIGSQPAAHAIADRWEPVYEYRSKAVHFLETPAAPAAHPVGTNTAPENVRYNAEAARGATELLLDTLRAFRDDPKPAITKWSSDFTKAIAGLERSWGDLSLSP